MKKIILVLILTFSSLFSFEMYSWNLTGFEHKNFVLLEDQQKNGLLNFIDDENIDIVALQGIKNINIKEDFILKNHFLDVIYNNYTYEDNMYFGFIVNKKYMLTTMIQYPDEENLWKFPPVMLEIPELKLGILNIQTNPDKQSSLSITGHSLNFVRREVYDIRKVLSYFKLKGYNPSKLIIVGDFGLEKSDLEEILGKEFVLFDQKTTSKSLIYGNENFNVLSYISGIEVKTNKTILEKMNLSEMKYSNEVSNYYPVLIKK